jgi:hypothetical protein
LLKRGLAGIAFAVVGILSAVFWSAVMTVLSIIPGIGIILVWGPAAAGLAIFFRLSRNKRLQTETENDEKLSTETESILFVDDEELIV